jgi:hypothetical protein
MLLDKVIDERGDVVAPFPQRRDLDGITRLSL